MTSTLGVIIAKAATEYERPSRDLQCVSVRRVDRSPVPHPSERRHRQCHVVGDLAPGETISLKRAQPTSIAQFDCYQDVDELRQLLCLGSPRAFIRRSVGRGHRCSADPKRRVLGNASAETVEQQRQALRIPRSGHRPPCKVSGAREPRPSRYRGIARLTPHQARSAPVCFTIERHRSSRS